MEADPIHDAVEQLLVRFEICEPPVDAIEVAKRLGVVVAVDGRLVGRARRAQLAVSDGVVQAAIFLRPEPREERRQWSVAHELGEHLAPELFAASGDDVAEASSEVRERTASAFAEALLLPQRRFLREGDGCDWDLPALKRTFATASHELIARRIAASVPGCQVAVVDDGRLHARWSVCGGRERLEPSERAIVQCCARSAEAQERRCEHFRLRCWPIHEPGYRREILLTQAIDVEF